MKEYVGVMQCSAGLTIFEFGLEQGKALAKDPTTQGINGWPTRTGERAQGVAPQNDADYYGTFEVGVPPDIMENEDMLNDYLSGIAQGLAEAEAAEVG